MSFVAIISDTTTVDDVTWGDLKLTAMSSSYETSTAYTDLSDYEKVLVTALIAEQDDLESYDSPLQATDGYLAWNEST